VVLNSLSLVIYPEEKFLSHPVGLLSISEETIETKSRMMIVKVGRVGKEEILVKKYNCKS
jgi:hypothetical protein